MTAKGHFCCKPTQTRRAHFHCETSGCRVESVKGECHAATRSLSHELDHSQLGRSARALAFRHCGATQRIVTGRILASAPLAYGSPNEALLLPPRTPMADAP